MDFHEERIETRTVYEGLIVKVRKDAVRLQNGAVAPREIVEHPGGVGIVPVTADNKVLMVRQYRYPVEETVTEIPAGKLDDGEDPLACAVRELSEETGCTAGELVYLGAVYPSPGYCKETLHIYLALDLRYGEKHLDENELLSVEAVAMDELVGRVMSGELTDAKTIIGILKARLYLEERHGKDGSHS